MNRWLWFVLPFALLLTLTHLHTRATDEPLTLESQRTVFVVNSERNTTTTVVTFNVRGGGDTFYWLFAVPETPHEIGFLSSAYDVNQLDYRTELSLNEPFTPCQLKIPEPYGSGGPGAPTQLPTSVVDYQLFAGSNVPTSLSEWGVSLSDEGNKAVTRLTEDGFIVVGLQITKQPYDKGRFGYNDPYGLPPIVMTYQDTAPILPIPILKEVDQDTSIQLHSWIVAAQKYVPANYPLEALDFGKLPPQSDRQPFTFQPRFSEGYQNLRHQTVMTNPEHASFIIEGAQYDVLLYSEQDDKVETSWKNVLPKQSYVTRLYSEWTSQFKTELPEFVPAPDNAPFPVRKEDTPSFYGPNDIVLGDWVDPFKYYGCSTKSVVAPETLANLPSERRYIPEIRAEIAYPKNWVITSFRKTIWLTAIEYQAIVIAPIPMTLDDIVASFDGTRPVPMLVLANVPLYVFDRYPNPFRETLEVLIPAFYVTQSEKTIGKWVAELRSSYIAHLPPGASSQNFNFLIDHLVITFVTTAEDWGLHEEMYRAMIDYAGSYQYFSSSILRHTLFMGDGYKMLQIPFPGGWEETYQSGDVYIAPATSNNVDNGAYVHLHPLGWDDMKDPNQILATYNLETNLTLDDLSNIRPFKANGRRGYVFVEEFFFGFPDAPRAYIVEVSAPEPLFASSDALLTAIREGIRRGTNPDERG